MKPEPVARALSLGLAAAALSAAPLLAQTSGSPAPRGSLGGAAIVPPAAATLAPGDRIRIEVWRRPELSGEFPVLGSGAIGHPLYKDVSVAGVPVGTAEQRVREYLTRLESDPQFVFVPLLRVAVGGEVRSPGLLHLPPETTVAEAVARAGGPTERGKLDDVRLIRDTEERKLDLRDPRGEGVRLRIQSGDELIVRRKSGFNFMQHVFLPVMATTSTVFSIIRLSR